MGATVTSLVELLVGAACVALAVAVWRHPGTAVRVSSVVLALAGLVAIGHAAMRLAQ
ncbi:MAG TPA: hypothetical protein VIB62_10880 [Actinomycetota bacterium]